MRNSPSAVNCIPFHYQNILLTMHLDDSALRDLDEWESGIFYSFKAAQQVSIYLTQPIKYMADLNCQYGFMSNHEEIIFLRQVCHHFLENENSFVSFPVSTSDLFYISPPTLLLLSTILKSSHPSYFNNCFQWIQTLYYTMTLTDYVKELLMMTSFTISVDSKNQWTFKFEKLWVLRTTSTSNRT